MAEDDEQFWNKIIMYDFTLNGTVNKQNCRIYATENPQEIQEVPLHDYYLWMELKKFSNTFKELISLYWKGIF